MWGGTWAHWIVVSARPQSLLLVPRSHLCFHLFSGFVDFRMCVGFPVEPPSGSL